jgi:uncharacterized membrane protein YesL
MREFFSLEGPFYKYGGLLADVMILSLMWIFFSIPLFTVGASTTAVFYVTTRRIAEREGYITRDFWQAFKTNFKKATLVWLLMVVVVLVLIMNIMNIGIVGRMAVFMLPFQFLFLIEIAFMTVYIFPLMARFDMKFLQLIKSAFYMANRHLLTSISCVVLFTAILMAVYMYPIAFFIAIGLYAWLSSYMIMRVFKKYRPEMDRDPRLEIAEIEAKKEQEAREARWGLTGEKEEEIEMRPWEKRPFWETQVEPVQDEPAQEEPAQEAATPTQTEEDNPYRETPEA